MRRCARDLYAFLQATFPIVSAGTELLLNWHLEAMTAALIDVIRGEDTAAHHHRPPAQPEVHLRFGCAAGLCPWDMTRQRRIICVSYSEALARKHANDCRALMRSPEYRRLFPGTRISSAKDTEFEVMTTARGFRLATSVGGTLTGRGGNLVIIDDPMKPQDAQSETARENVLQWYSNTLLSRLDNKVEDSIIVVMQRLHPEDLVGHLLEQDGWTHLNLPAIAEVETMVPIGGNRFYRRTPGSVLHPERESLAVLNELKRDNGLARLRGAVPAGTGQGRGQLD